MAEAKKRADAAAAKAGAKQEALRAEAQAKAKAEGGGAAAVPSAYALPSTFPPLAAAAAPKGTCNFPHLNQTGGVYTRDPAFGLRFCPPRGAGRGGAAAGFVIYGDEDEDDDDPNGCG